MSLAPKHFVCRSDSFYVGRRIPRSPPLTSSFPTTSTSSFPSSFSSTTYSMPRGCSYGRTAPSTSSGVRMGRSSARVRPALCTTNQMKKECSKPVVSTRQWMPKLETMIMEKKKKRKISYTPSHVCYVENVEIPIENPIEGSKAIAIDKGKGIATSIDKGKAIAIPIGKEERKLSAIEQAIAMKDEKGIVIAAEDKLV